MESTRSEPSASSGMKRTRDDGSEGPSKRRAPGGPFALQGVELTRPQNGKAKNHKNGERVKLTANFFALRVPNDPRDSKFKWSIYKYTSIFEPECHNARMKSAMIAQHKPKIGGFLFDGIQLFVTRQLDDEELNLVSKTREGTEYKIQLKFTKIVTTNDREYLQILNLILRRATQGLKLNLVNRDYYDAAAKIDLAAFRIQLWPGYQTSIRQHEHDILLNVDIIHKVMRTDTVYDLLKETLRADPSNFENSFKQKVLGMTVLTSYNNATYRIDDVDFTLSPLTTFKKKDTDVSIKQYFSERYQLNIKDEKQPLLITKPKEKSRRGGEDKPTWLVPELCNVTGLSERQRTDISMKNATKQYFQMNPRIRKERILAYNRRVQGTTESIKVFDEWGLELKKNLVDVDGCLLKAEILRFGNNREQQVQNAGWDRECGRGFNLFQPATLKRWYIIYPAMMERDISKFVKRIVELGRNMGFEIGTPREHKVQNDRQLAAKVDELANSNPQLMFFVVSSNKNNNADIYSSIKKRCFSDYAIPSQVATKYILSKDKGYDSVVTKIAIQMCSKLGGAPWHVKIPMGGIMTVGFDVSKDSQNKTTSYGCLVATMDLRESADFFAFVASYSSTETLSKEFGIGIIKAATAFREKHGTLPKKIIIYRGGVGDGDLAYLRDQEVKQMEEKLKLLYGNAEQELELVFIVVTKKINARIFQGDMNPKPGTVVDDVITMNERCEFYLISQSGNQGTVSPTNYNIIHDTSEAKMTVERLQIWTYKQTHLYYNWCGTTRVPSVLQYATKLCFLVSNYMHKIPNSNLENNLYFL